MRLYIAAGSAMLALSGCLMHPPEPTTTFAVAGNYKAVAECFYLKGKAEGWKKDDFDSMNASRVMLGTTMADVGVAGFVGIGPDRTQVTLPIPQPDKLSPLVRECSTPA